MREFRFRGMDIINNKWLYGNLEIPLIDQSKSKCYIIGYSYGQYQKHEVNPRTLGQYTGLKDRNGREIYEGDIIQVNKLTSESFEMLPKKLEVKFSDGMYQLFKDDECLVSLNLTCMDDREVIGNIYENTKKQHRRART